MKGKKIAAIAVSVIIIAATLCFAIIAFTGMYSGNNKIGSVDSGREDGDMSHISETGNENGQNPETVTEHIYPATGEFVKTIGRTARKDNTTWLVQSGSAVEFTVSGVSAEVVIEGDSGISNGSDNLPRYAVLLDDEIILDDLMSVPEKRIKLFESETVRTAKVKIIHLSEAMFGTVGVRSIYVESGSSPAVGPTPEKRISIEFIGDSITCAYGVEDTSNSDMFSTATENFMDSYAYLTAEKLNADYSAVCYSGFGVISAYSADGSKRGDSLVPDIYDLIGNSGEYDDEWDFSEQANDVVVVNLGTNDGSYVLYSDVERRSREFVDGYAEFLRQIRALNPDSYIICTIGTMGRSELYPLIEEAVGIFREDTGDTKITSYESEMQDPEDGYGTDWHPSLVTQQKSADALADRICDVLGIDPESMGIDIAAESEYELYTDPEKGGSATDLASDKEKSFRVSTEMGGRSPDAVEVRIKDIELKKGGVYRPEFDYASDAPASIPVLISSEDGTLLYYDEIGPSAEKVHYSGEFTLQGSDCNADMVFQLGIGDEYEFALYDIKFLMM